MHERPELPLERRQVVGSEPLLAVQFCLFRRIRWAGFVVDPGLVVIFVHYGAQKSPQDPELPQ